MTYREKDQLEGSELGFASTNDALVRLESLRILGTKIRSSFTDKSEGSSVVHFEHQLERLV